MSLNFLSTFLLQVQPDVNYTFAKKYETRVARLTFSYHFGSSVKLQKRKETGVDDELRRIKY